MVLEGWFVDALSTYLVIDPKETSVGIFSRDVHVARAELRAEAINQSLTSSPLLLHHGFIRRLHAKLRILQIDSISLVLEGVDLVFRPRPLDSPWWEESQNISQEKKRVDRFSLLDPEGAAIDAVAEALELTRATSSTMVGRLTNAAVARMRIELRNCTVAIETGCMAGSFIRIGFTLDSLVMEEGNFHHDNDKGLLRAATSAVIADEAVAVLKLCRVSGFGMWMESQWAARSEQDIKSKEPAAEIADAQGSQSGQKAGNVSDGIAEQRSCGSYKMRRRCLLKQGDHKLLLRYSPGSVDYIEMDMNEMDFQMDTEDIAELMIVMNSVRGQGFSDLRSRRENKRGNEHSGNEVNDLCSGREDEGVYERSKNEVNRPEEETGDDGAHSGVGNLGTHVKDDEIDMRRRAEERTFRGIEEELAGPVGDRMESEEKDQGAKTKIHDRKWAVDLWHKGLMRVLEQSSKKQLARAVLAGIARRRYVALYEEWLKDLRRDLAGRGWGDKEGKQSKGRGLLAALRDMEKGMPEEAVVLGRRVARKRSVEDLSLLKLEREGPGEQVSDVPRSGWSLGAAWRILGTIRGLASKPIKAANAKRNKGAEQGPVDKEADDESLKQGEGNDPETPGKIVKDGSGNMNIIPVLPGTDLVFTVSMQRVSITVGQASAANRMVASTSEGKDQGRDAKLGAKSSVVAPGLPDGLGTGSTLLSTVHEIKALCLCCEDLSAFYGTSLQATGVEFVCGNVLADCVTAKVAQEPINEVAHSKQRGSLEMTEEERWAMVGQSAKERWVLDMDNAVPVVRSSSSKVVPGIRRGSAPDAGVMKEGWVSQGFRERMGLPPRMQEMRASSDSVSSRASMGSPRGNNERREGLALAVEVKRPFLMFEMESKVGWLSKEQSAGSLSNCRVAVGQLECFLNGDVIGCGALMAAEAGVAGGSQSSVDHHEGVCTPANQRQNKDAAPLQNAALSAAEFLKQTAMALTAAVRDNLHNLVPNMQINLAAFICGPRLILTDIVPTAQRGKRGGAASKGGKGWGRWQDQALIVDLGQVEVGVWPVLPGRGGKELEALQNGHNGKADSIWGWRSVWARSRNMREANAWWDPAVEEDAWRKRPVGSLISAGGRRNSLMEETRVWNNVRIAVTGMSIGMGEKKGIYTQVSSWILAPAKMVAHASAYRERVTSILEAVEAVSSTLTARVSPVILHVPLEKINSALEVLSMLAKGYWSGLNTGLAARQFFPVTSSSISEHGVETGAASEVGKKQTSEVASSCPAQTSHEENVFSMLFRLHIASIGALFLEDYQPTLGSGLGHDTQEGNGNQQQPNPPLPFLTSFPHQSKSDSWTSGLSGNQRFLSPGRDDDGRDGAFVDSFWIEMFAGDGYRAHASLGWEGFRMGMNVEGEDGEAALDRQQVQKSSEREGKGKEAARRAKKTAKIECSIGQCCLNLCGPQGCGQVGDIENIVKRRMMSEATERRDGDKDVHGEEDAEGIPTAGSQVNNDHRDEQGEVDGQAGPAGDEGDYVRPEFGVPVPESFAAQESVDAGSTFTDFGSAADRFSVWSSRYGRSSTFSETGELGTRLSAEGQIQDVSKGQGGSRAGGSDGEAPSEARSGQKLGMLSRSRSLGSMRDLEKENLEHNVGESGGGIDLRRPTDFPATPKAAPVDQRKHTGSKSTHSQNSGRRSLSRLKGLYVDGSSGEKNKGDTWEDALSPRSVGEMSFMTAEAESSDGELMTEMGLLNEMSTSGIMWGKQWAVASLQIGSLVLRRGDYDGVADLRAVAEQVMKGSDEIDITLLVAENLTKVRMKSEGGLVYIDTPVLEGVITRAWRYYTSLLQSVSKMEILKMALLSSRPVSAETVTESGDVSDSHHNASSSSGMSITWQGEGSMVISDLSVVLARPPLDANVTGEGLLLELDSSLNVVMDMQEILLSTQISGFAARGLLTSRKPLTVRRADIIGGNGYHKEVDESVVRDPELAVQFPTETFYEAERETRQAGSEEVLFEGEPRVILDCMESACDLRRAIHQDGSADDLGPSKEGVWEGRVSIGGLHAAVTTYEVQLLTGLLTPLLRVSSSMTSAENKEDDAGIFPGAMTSSSVPALPDSETESPEIPYLPHGSVIAIRDVYEESFVAVEEHSGTLGTFSLTSVRHYGLAGERALFKVKRLRNKKHKEQPWFCLLSLYARHSTTGRALRLHYQPASALPEIATTNNGAWEQWQLLPAKPPDYLDGVIAHDVDEGNKDGDDKEQRKDKTSAQRTVYLENKKAGRCLSISDGSVVLGKYSHPLKIKIVALPKEGETDVEFQMEEAEERAKRKKRRKGESSAPEPVQELVRSPTEQVAIALANIPSVNVVIKDGLSITLLYEAAGGAHLLPLVRARGEKMEATVQLGTEKTRFIASCSIGLDYFEVERGKWEKIFSRISLEMLSRGRVLASSLARKEWKAPSRTFITFQKVDMFLNEAALDTCLFLVGALDLAGPYTMKFSPIQANRCQVQNHTGVPLNCHLGTWHKIQPQTAEDFLIRRMASRRDIRAALMSSSIVIGLGDPTTGVTISALMSVPLTDPGVQIVNFQLRGTAGDQKSHVPLVVSISKQSQEGLFVSISPLLTVGNLSGMPLFVRYWKLGASDENGKAEDGVMRLDKNEAVDDLMHSFNVRTEGGERSHLFGDDCMLSVKPVDTETGVAARIQVSSESGNTSRIDWSASIVGNEAIVVTGLVEWIQQKIKSTIDDIWGRQVTSSLSSVFCPVLPMQMTEGKVAGRPGEDVDLRKNVDSNKAAQEVEENDKVEGHEPQSQEHLVDRPKGFCFLLNASTREVPVRVFENVDGDEESGMQVKSTWHVKETSVGIASPFLFSSSSKWMKQRQLLILPTMRICNLLTKAITVTVVGPTTSELRSSTTGEKGQELKPSEKIRNQSHISGIDYVHIGADGGQSCMYTRPEKITLVIHHTGLGISSEEITLDIGGGQFGSKGVTMERLDSQAAFSQSGMLGKDKDYEIEEREILFGDGSALALLQARRAEDGVFEVTVFAKYYIVNATDIPLLCVAKQKQAQQRPQRRGFFRRAVPVKVKPEWPEDRSAAGIHGFSPGSRTPWLHSSQTLLLRRPEPSSRHVVLDLDSIGGLTEISLTRAMDENLDERFTLGVQLGGTQKEMAQDISVSRNVRLAPRYVVVNEGNERLYVCQDGFQDDPSASLILEPGGRRPLLMRVGNPNSSGEDDTSESPRVAGRGYLREETTLSSRSDGLGSDSGTADLNLRVCIRPQGSAWRWSGPVQAGAIGSFTLRVKSSSLGSSRDAMKRRGAITSRFVLANVVDESPTLVMRLQLQGAESAVPYRIENHLRRGSIAFAQKGLTEMEFLGPGETTGYVWDNIKLDRRLVVSIAGTQLHQEINLDKIKSRRVFRKAIFDKLLMPFRGLGYWGSQDEGHDEGSEEADGQQDEQRRISYEVYADGPTRVLLISEGKLPDRGTLTFKGSGGNRTMTELWLRLEITTLTLLERERQNGFRRNIIGAASSVLSASPIEALSVAPLRFSPLLYLRIMAVNVEYLNTLESMSFELQVERVDIDVKLEGTTNPVLLRPHKPSTRVQRSPVGAQSILEMAFVVSNRVKTPMHVQYASFLMRAVELNLDEETLMRLVPFARSSLSKASSDWNKPIFFERFEVNPIMIIASFDPRPSRAEGYSSRQQALRTLLHSVIKIPAVKGTTVKLNGVLLQHALLSYNQLVMKCAQHYSWYAMKAAYVARGVELLPPAFASLFDDSASISIDAFFDPSQGFVDAKNFAMGMFSVLRKGLRLKGFAGTQRYLGELEGTMRQAGSNILYAIITEVSDNILKGAETHGLEGMMRGFRRGLLSVAMRPYVLKNAVVRGSGTKRIQLDKSLGTDEVYVEGYLQAMVDVLFRQEYLRIKVSNDQVILKNLPPNSTLSEEIVGAVRAFLTKEGLLQGQTSAAAANVLRRLRGENEANLARAVFSMSEQLLTILAVRTLKRKILQLFKIQQRQEPELQRQPSFPTESEDSVLVPSTAGQRGGGFRGAARNMILSSVFAYLDGRLCRNIPNPFVRRIVSGVLISLFE